METISRESQERLPYRLLITVHRHGPKQGASGPLTYEGKEEVANYFEDAYEGISNDLPEEQGVDLEHSPIHRTAETAGILKDRSGQKIRSIKSDERLSEGRIAEFQKDLPGLEGKGGVWMSRWIKLEGRPHPKVKTGREAAGGFASWLLEKIGEREAAGGEQEIDAISHGPLMLAFMAILEEETGQALLPRDWDRTENFLELVNFLEYMNISASDANPDEITIGFKGGTATVSKETLQKIAALA